MQTKVKIALLILVITLFLPVISAFDIIAPEPNDEILNQQPMFSWKSATGKPTYTLLISTTPDFSTADYTYTTNDTFYQLQQTLAQGTWYWQVSTNNTQTITNNFTIIQPPTYTITPKLDTYDHNQQVDFEIDAPLGTAINITISEVDFFYAIDNLSDKTFSTFLEPGTYTLAATFNYQGMINTYEDSFILQERQTPTHIITLNVTDQDDEPLSGVLVELVADEKTYEGTTNNKGLLIITVQEENYDVSFSKENYFDNSIDERITKEEHFSVTMYHEESFTKKETPELTTTAVIVQPEITIISPTYKETIKESLHVNFTATKTSNIKSCDLLFKNKEQQGWILAASSTSITNENMMTYEEPTSGESHIKIQCLLKNEETISSEPRTIIIAPKPQHHEKIQETLDLLNEQTIPSITDPFILALDIQASLSKTKKELASLDAEYLQTTAEGITEDIKKKDEAITKKLEELEEELIIAVDIVEREDAIILFDESATKDIIKTYVQGRNLSEKQQEKLASILQEQQADYTMRAKKVVAEITLLNQDKKYLTGITKTIQSYTDTKEEQLHIIELFPYTFLQQTGTPTILNSKGETLTIIQDNKLQLQLSPDESYTLLFDGNIKIDPKMLNDVAIWQQKEYAEELAQQTIVNSITGAVTGLFDNTISTSPFLWLFLAIIIAAIIVNPLGSSTDRKTTKKFKQVTATIHDTLDLIEQGSHEHAFTHVPRIIEQYESLPPTHQEKLQFAIANLSSELQAYDISQLITNAQLQLAQLNSKEELTSVIISTKDIITNYKELESPHKQRLKPELIKLQQELVTKQELLQSEKVNSKHPLP